MRTTVLIMVVVALHCAAIGALFFIQGCGTTSGTSTQGAVPMPPTTDKKPAAKPVVKPLEPAGKIGQPDLGAKGNEVKHVAKVESKEGKATAKVEPKGAKAEAVTTAVGTKEYTVQKGDSLALIAKRLKVKTSELAELNKIADPNKIRLGQKLMIPAHADMAGAAKATGEAAPAVKTEASAHAMPAAGNGKEYTVQKGDIPSSIAKKLGVKLSALKEANKTMTDKSLKAGQKLVIPEAAAAPAVSPAPAPTPEPVSAPVTLAPTPIGDPSISQPAPVPTPVPAGSTPAVSSVPAPAGPAGGSAPVAPAPQTTAQLGGDKGVMHEVRAGEDLVSISKTFAVKVSELAEVNGLSTNAVLAPGQKIKIP